MIDFVEMLDSRLDTIVTEEECVQLLKDYVVKDMWHNYKDLFLEKLGNRDFYTERVFTGICENLYKNWYVNDNWYGNTNSSQNAVNTLMREKLPPVYFQCFQLLSVIHKMIRRNCVYG